jgi:CDP-diacylglycerol--glycerol-3-phosphate 3-phosphatidyltransferase
MATPDMWTIPNLLTLLRILLIPVFVAVFYLPVPWAGTGSALVFAVAGFTDWLDGHLARRWEQTTSLGAFLDPVADKLMVAVALVLLVQAQPTVILAIAAAIIIGREITISALREWMAELGARGKVAVSMMGKVKTTAQMVSIFLLLFQDDLWGLPLTTIGYVLLYLAALLTLWSMLVYLKAAWPNFHEPHPDEIAAAAEAESAADKKIGKKD